MIAQPAFHVRGLTVHAEASCVQTRPAPVVLEGAHLPVDRYGQQRVWTPCLRCGLPLVTALLAETGAPAVPALVRTWAPQADEPSWRSSRRELVCAFAEELRGPAGLVVARGADAPGGMLAATTLTVEASRVLRAVLRLVPLPAPALDLAGADPAAFATAAAVFAVLAEQHPDPTPAPDHPAAPAWAGPLWDTATAVAAPAGASS